MTEFTFRLICLGIPGAICYFFLAKITGRRGRNSLELTYQILIYSVLSYLLVDLVRGTLNCLFTIELVPLTPIIFSTQNFLTSRQIASAALSGGLLAFLLAFAMKRAWLNRFAISCKIFNRLGDEDLWHFFHSLPASEKTGGWLYLRDHKLNLVYYGEIRYWSESAHLRMANADLREAIIMNVSVYTNDSREHLYDTPILYVARKCDELTIEGIKPKSELKGKAAESKTLEQK